MDSGVDVKGVVFQIWRGEQLCSLLEASLLSQCAYPTYTQIILARLRQPAKQIPPHPDSQKRLLLLN